ncbi:MAG: hypothetical protein KKC01_12065 [Gammaproteobacteria bacterium]|nr:hypothetical protein [Gammaproteobacteria bacterium]
MATVTPHQFSTSEKTVVVMPAWRLKPGLAWPDLRTMLNALTDSVVIVVAKVYAMR